MLKTIYKLFLVVGIVYCSISVHTLYAEAPIETVKSQTSIEEYVRYYAFVYKTSADILLDVMNCESGGSMKPKGSNDGGRAHGAFQFHIPTWEMFSKELGENLDITSAEDQAKLAAWAFSKGYGSHWTCLRLVR